MENMKETVAQNANEIVLTNLAMGIHFKPQSRYRGMSVHKQNGDFSWVMKTDKSW